ncbi:MAG: hypothetical protein KME17_07650 [Cyanosarcina radialis HA8281-LM2]|jgi:hypothetical protein|nr:hypothetical protein [Cyanosarcina radialis HA8281-LM2]
MLASVKTLLESIVDYAGLFPPAKLDLPAAMTNYDRYCRSADAWMLGRFILPASRLNEFLGLLPTLASKDSQPRQWTLSTIISQDWEADLSQVKAAIEHDNIAIASLEFSPVSPPEIANIIPRLPLRVEAFFEIPFTSNLDSYLEVLASTNAAAKIRTGGITAEAFPESDRICRSILAFAAAKIPFKATAGLHHPLLGKYRLTYEPNSPSAQMYGFLNVAFLAALAYYQKVTLTEGIELLAESSVTSFKWHQDGVYWRDRYLNISEVEASRQHFFRSFGSCSFEEPIDDLKQIKLL